MPTKCIKCQEVVDLEGTECPKCGANNEVIVPGIEKKVERKVEPKSKKGKK